MPKFLDKILEPIITKISNSVTSDVISNIEKRESNSLSGEIVKSEDGRKGLVIDPGNFYNKGKGVKKPTRISFQTLRRMSKAVHIARLCINTLKHKITQTDWTIKQCNENEEVNEHHINVLKNFFDNPNSEDSFRTFLDKIMEDILVLDAGCFEKVNNNGGLPAEIYYVDGATIKPLFDEHGKLGISAYGQWMPMNQNETPDAEWNKDEMVYIMQNPQADVLNYGYGLSPLEGIIMAATNILNADNYMGQYFDIGTLPPKLINLGPDIQASEVESFRAYWKSEIEGKPWKTAIYGGGELSSIDMESGKPIDMQFENYQVWLMKIICAAYEISPQDIGMTAEMGLNRALGEVQQNISNTKGYRSILQLLKETFNRKIIRDWFGFDDVEFDWVGLDALNQKEAAEIFAIESKAGAVSINEYRIQKGLKPIKGGIKPLLITTQGIQEIDATPLEDIHSQELKDEEEETETKEVEKKVHLEDYICWMDDRGFGQPFIWTDKFGKVGKVIKPPVAVNINGVDVEVKCTKEMSGAGLNVKPVTLVAAVDINNYLPSFSLRKEFGRYQSVTPEYYSRKWETRFGNSRRYDQYTVVDFIDGRSLVDDLLLDDMKRVPGEYEKAIEDLANLWKYEKEHGMGDRRANQYIISPDKRGWGFDYQFTGNPKAWERYKYSISNNLETVPRLKQLFNHLTGLDAEDLETHKSINKSSDDGIEKGIFTSDDIKKVWDKLGIDYDEYNLDEFTIGMNEELEHKNITGGDPIMTAKIVMAHLNEKPDYYTRLNEAMKKSIEKGYYKERQIEEQNNFWKGVMLKPEKELASHLVSQSKKLKPNIARIIRDEAKAQKAIASDAVLSEAADEAPKNNLGLKYTKSIDKFYKDAFELGVKNFSKKVAKKLKGKGITPKMIEIILGRKVEKSIERSGIYSKLKERGTNMIKTIAANKQARLLNFIENEADQGKPMSEISDAALEKFSLPLEEYEVSRIAKTETAWAANQGSIEAGQELGIEKYEVLLDPDACEDCQDAYGDGDVMSRDELEAAGDPPLHPNCECSVEPAIDDLDALADSIASQINEE